MQSKPKLKTTMKLKKKRRMKSHKSMNLSQVMRNLILAKRKKEEKTKKTMMMRLTIRSKSEL